PAQFCGPGGMNPVLTEFISISPSPPSLSVCTLGPAETSPTPSLRSQLCTSLFFPAPPPSLSSHLALYTL
ncbi:hypothetical protein KUCAC02_006275, partial [Chaenocephalus aceratus]